MPLRASGWGLEGFRWGVLPVCGGEGGPGPRGWWQGGPLSSSPPLGPGSAVQTGPPAPWLTPAEPPRSHTAPYTLHGPKGKRGVGGFIYIHIAWSTLKRGRAIKTNTPLLLNLLCADAGLKSKGLYYHSLTHHSSSDTFLGTCWHHSGYTLPMNIMINFEGLLTQILNFISKLTRKWVTRKWCACDNMHSKDGGQDDGLIQWSLIMALLGYLIQHVSKSPTIQINKPFHTHHKHERVVWAFEPLRHNNSQYKKVERATFSKDFAA